MKRIIYSKINNNKYYYGLKENDNYELFIEDSKNIVRAWSYIGYNISLYLETSGIACLANFDTARRKLYNSKSY